MKEIGKFGEKTQCIYIINVVDINEQHRVSKIIIRNIVKKKKIVKHDENVVIIGLKRKITNETSKISLV